MGYRGAMSLGALFAKGVTGGCEGDVLSTQDGSCCSVSDFNDVTYRDVMGLGSWMALNETRTWNALMALAQTPAGRGFANGVQALAYDKGWNETDPVVTALANQVLSAVDGFARLFPRRRWSVVSNVENYGPKNCGPYPMWGQTLTPQSATFDAAARARFVAAVPSAPSSYLDTMSKTGVLEYLWHMGEAWNGQLSTPNGLGMPAPPLPVMTWLNRALTVINSDPIIFTGQSWADSHGLIGMRPAILPDQMLTFGSGSITPSPWLRELIKVLGAPTVARAPSRVGVMRISLPSPAPTAMSPASAASLTTTTKTPWIVAAVAVPLAIGGAMMWRRKRATGG